MKDAYLDEVAFNENEKQLLDRYYASLVKVDTYRDFITGGKKGSNLGRSISRPEFNRPERSWYNRE